MAEHDDDFVNAGSLELLDHLVVEGGVLVVDELVRLGGDAVDLAAEDVVGRGGAERGHVRGVAA